MKIFLITTHNFTVSEVALTCEGQVVDVLDDGLGGGLLLPRRGHHGAASCRGAHLEPELSRVVEDSLNRDNIKYFLRGSNIFYSDLSLVLDWL